MFKKIKREHRIYKETRYYKSKCLVGRWQYIFANKNRMISMIKLNDYLGYGDLWEIRAIKGKPLIDGIERFDSKKDAEKRIRSLLCQK
jgi:hypothetical protein